MAATLIGLSGLNISLAQTEEEISALVEEALLLPEWSTIVTGVAGGGYKDNVFLSTADPQGSAFVGAAAELMVLHVPLEGPRFNLFTSTEGHYFFDVEHTEVVSFTQASVEQDFSEIWSGSFEGRYFYQDQVLDVSTTETNREAIAVVGHTIDVLPKVKARLPEQHWLEANAGVTRQFFNAPLDDYYVVGARLAVGRDFPRDSHVLVSYAPAWRPYDTEPARTASGQVITNSHRESFRHEVRVEWRQHWDEDQRWRTVFTTGVRANRENGGGYFDYNRCFVGQRIRYRAAGWEISVAGLVSQYNYENQPATPATPEKRRRTEWIAGLDIERQLTKRLMLALHYDYGNVLSNDPLETYSVNMVSASFHWEF